MASIFFKVVLNLIFILSVTGPVFSKDETAAPAEHPQKGMVWAWVMTGFPLSYDYSGLRDRPLWTCSGDELEDCRTMILAGKRAGLDGFMIQGNPRKLRFEAGLKQGGNWLKAAEELDFKIAFEIEMYYATKNEVSEWIRITFEKFHDSPAAYRIDGKVVYFLWLRQSMPKIPFDVGRGEGTFPAEDWADILRGARKDTGGGTLFYADMFDSVRNSQPGGYTGYEKEKILPLMDGLWDFGGLHAQIMLNNGPVDKVLGKMQDYWDDSKAAKMNFLAGLIPGFWREETQWYVNPHGTSYYRTVWDKILEMHPFGVVVQSWNDYSEDAQIQPSARTGYCLAELTAHYADLYRGIAPKLHPSRRVWISQPLEIHRGEKAYSEFLSLPSKAHGFTIKGMWVNENGQALASFNKEFSTAGLAAEIPELPFSSYGDSKAVRIEGTVSSSASSPTEPFTTKWIWINGISRFDKFTSRYLLETDRNGDCSIKLSRLDDGKFHLDVTNSSQGRASLWRKSSRNIGETPAKPELLHTFKPSDEKSDWAEGKTGIELRYFELDHPDWNISMSVSQGKLSECRKFGRRVDSLEADTKRISWTSPKLGRIGLSTANSAFEGVDAVWSGFSPDANISINVNGVEHVFKASALGTRPSVPLDRDGFLMLRSKTPFSLSNGTIDGGQKQFTFSLPKEGACSGDMIWAELDMLDGRIFQSLPVSISVPESTTAPLKTCYYDHAQSKTVDILIGGDQALILDWEFNSQDGSLVGDSSAYDNFGRFGCVFSSFFVGTQAQKPKWNAGSLAFDGIDDFVAIPTGAMPEGGFTVCCRIKTRPTGKLQTLLMLGYSISMQIDPNGYLLANIGSNSARSSKPLGEDWTEVSLVYDIASVRLYVDRSLAASKTVPGNTPILFAGERLLGIGYNAAAPFAGTIDYLKIWAAQIQPSDTQPLTEKGGTK
ncbi:MAG: endo-1,3-alpha-glucanase family glycosylhydrolase [Victivallales bacterium]